MGHCDFRTATSLGHILEELISGVPARFFQRYPARTRDMLHINPSALHSQSEFSRQLTDVFPVPVRFISSEHVVEMCYVQPQPVFVCQRLESVQQSHGIGAAGHADDHAIPVAQHIIVFNGLPNCTQHSLSPFPFKGVFFHTGCLYPAKGGAVLTAPTTS